MKPLFWIILLWTFVITNGYAKPVNITVHFDQAKTIYNAMTGPVVQNEGAAGHIIRTGKSIVCRYTDVDMDDEHGHPTPSQDPRRYDCTIKFDENGFALKP